MTEQLDLDQRLHALGTSVDPPVVPLAEDIARGRRRRRLHRSLATGAAMAGVAVIALGIPLAGDALSDSRGAGPASGPVAEVSDPATSDPSPTERPDPPSDERRTGAELLQTYRDVVAEHLDPDGTHLQQKPDNLQTGAGLGTKLGWSVPGQQGLGMVQVFVGRGWSSFVGADCDSGAECRHVTVDGTEATVVEWNGATTVVVHRGRGAVAITVDSLFGNNSMVPVAGMDIPLDAVVRAAADERLTPATPTQIAHAGTSMFPGLAQGPGPGHPRFLPGPA